MAATGASIRTRRRTVRSCTSPRARHAVQRASKSASRPEGSAAWADDAGDADVEIDSLCAMNAPQVYLPPEQGSSRHLRSANRV
jgi:hypothetical protein